MHKLNREIFREYDIRGIAGETITIDSVSLIGRAFAKFILGKGGKSVSVGRDCRDSSPELADFSYKGLTSTGLDVIDIGLVTTPMLYFSLFSCDVDGGVMITASHNPKEYNGLKLCSGRESMFGDEIQMIREIAEKGNFPEGKGSVTEKAILEEYLSYLEKNITVKQGMKVAIDCGNATVGLTAPTLLKKFGCELTELYTDLDGSFPNHHPDPTVEENLTDLKKAVIENNCEVGLAFDGDGDRIGVVDNNAQVIWGDMLVLVYARELLKTMPGAKIIGDVKCSSRLFNAIEKAGGKPIMWKTGHSLIKSKIKIENAALAGEMSGHIFFNDRFLGFDDALYAGLRLLEILSNHVEPFSELFSDIPESYSTPEIRVECAEDIKFKVVDKVKESLRNKYKVIDIDGVRVDFPDGWGLVRASNTQPALVLRFEAETRDRLGEIRSVIEKELEKATEEILLN